jgi:hypothetical protein
VKTKVTITLKDHRNIVVYLDKQSSVNLIDQFYDLCSGELEDNCFEVIVNSDHGKEFVVIKADEILYVQTKVVSQHED